MFKFINKKINSIVNKYKTYKTIINSDLIRLEYDGSILSKKKVFIYSFLGYHRYGRLIEEFDYNYYFKKYPDVKGKDPLAHYIEFGEREGRTPCENFHPKLYQEKNSGLKLGNGNVFCDYLLSDYDAVYQPEFKYDNYPIVNYKRKFNSAQEDSIKVTVICRTYNHEEFIEETLKGFIAQETTFKFKVLIGDDCSVDNTRNIIEKYANNYPDIIKFIKHETNLGPLGNLENLTDRIDTEYVAFCEGDDYWIDPYKLQKQVSFLDENKDYSICCHRVLIDDGEFGLSKKIDSKTSFDDLAKGNYIHMCSAVSRWAFKDGLRNSPFNFEAMPGDWQLHLLHAQNGDIHFINEVMAVYRRHEQGIWSDAIDPIALHKKYWKKELHFFESFDDENIKLKLSFLYKLLIKGYIIEWNIENLYELYNYRYKLFIENFHISDSITLIPNLPFEEFKRFITDSIKINVIVTTYNHEKYLAKCLDSILNQVVPFEFNIIICDDYSKDESSKIANKYKLKYPNKIIIKESNKNIGLQKNMEEGFAYCNSPFIAICEGDDYWNSNKKLLKQISELLVHPDATMCFNWLLLEDEKNGKETPHPQQSRLNSKIYSYFDIAQEPIIGNFSSCFYRKDAIDKIPEGFYKDSNAFDWLFNSLIASQGNVIFIKELLSTYRIHNGGLWSSNSKASANNKARKTRLKIKRYYHASLDKSRLENYEFRYFVDQISAISNIFFIKGWSYSIQDANGNPISPVVGVMFQNVIDEDNVFKYVLQDSSRKDVKKINNLEHEYYGFIDKVNLKKLPRSNYDIYLYHHINGQVYKRKLGYILSPALNGWNVSRENIK